MISTSIEQSKHLLELGLDTKTADMVWMCNKWLYSIKDNILNQEQFSEQDTLAWSLTALLKVMRKLNVVVTLQMTEMATWLRIKGLGGIWHKDIHVKDPMDAVYGGMLWLFEQGLIKKGDNDE